MPSHDEYLWEQFGTSNKTVAYIHNSSSVWFDTTMPTYSIATVNEWTLAATSQMNEWIELQKKQEKNKYILQEQNFFEAEIC